MRNCFCFQRTDQSEKRRNFRFMRIFAIAVLITMGVPWKGMASTRVPIINIRAARYAFTPSQITLKQGAPVELVFVAQDVPHGIVVKGLGIDLELPRHKAERIFLTPKTTGDFSGECSRYCGNGHNHMTFVVHVRP